MLTENENLLPTLNQFTGNDAAAARSALDDPELLAKIPLLNYTPLHQLKDLSLVRFRGMIQDMYDPEIYLERYEVKMEGSVSARMQEGKYRDCLVLNSGEHVNYNSDANVQSDRRTLFVVSIPGINAWTRDYEQLCNKQSLQAPTSAAQHANSENVKKRAAPSEEMDVDAEAPVNSVSVNGSEANKRQCLQKDDATQNNASAKTSMISAEYLVNAPIPERPGMSCIIKIYDDSLNSYTLNSIVDVVGFLSVDPGLDASTMDTIECMDFPIEVQAANPPPSLIPRIHAVAVHHLTHANPLLDARLQPQMQVVAKEADIDMHSVQKDLRMLLTLCLFNDDLAAEYLLCHLISTVYSRSEMNSLGKFTLNLCNFPKEAISQDYTKKFYEILELLLPVSHYLPMTLDKMNTAAFVPKKDYETNKLVSGLLQLAPHTQLVLDETCLEEGKLVLTGVSNIKSLANLINHQQIKCDFQFYDIDYNVDIPVLVLSEGRSMLPQNFAVPVKTDAESVHLISETLKAAQQYLQPVRLHQFRRYLTMAQTCVFTINADNSSMIQDDFVEMRKQNLCKSAEDLHSLLVLSRLLAIARGKTVFDKESWQTAKDMEAKRKERLLELSQSRRQL